MIIERAFNLVHNLDVPESKRKFWQQWATVVLTRRGDIIDVIKHFEAPDEFLHRRQMDIYPDTIQFTVQAGEMFTSLDSFKAKIEDAVRLAGKMNP
ncbi:MAG: hypothetical protein OEV28_08555 [Nitrospirota bacterium]|nr:hypothetical protein [Nitrospirota bacterium]